jgi:hypothetical protein
MDIILPSNGGRRLRRLALRAAGSQRLGEGQDARARRIAAEFGEETAQPAASATPKCGRLLRRLALRAAGSQRLGEGQDARTSRLAAGLGEEASHPAAGS